LVSKKIFLDINIVIDGIDKDRPNNTIASKLIYELIVNGYEIVISEDMLSTIYYIQKNKKRTLDFFKAIQYSWKISSFGKEVIRKAITLSLEKNLDLEDVLQCLCAKENDCQILITNDKKFYDCGLEILSAEAFLEKYDD
jgi:predicted nucleic acid-binding protein